MKKLLLLLCLPFIGFGQDNNPDMNKEELKEQLIEYINSYVPTEDAALYELGRLPDSIKINSSNICSWIGSEMYLYDMSIYNAIEGREPTKDEYLQDRHGGTQLEHLLLLLGSLQDKYYTILKYQQQTSNLTKKMCYAGSDYPIDSIRNGFNPITVQLLWFRIPEIKLRLSELSCYMEINCGRGLHHKYYD